MRTPNSYSNIRPKFLPHPSFFRLFILSLCLCSYAYSSSTDHFIGVKQVDGIWWMTKGTDEQFVTLGINHVEPQMIIGPHNIHHTVEMYGADIVYWHEQFNAQGSGAKKWLAEVKSNFTKWGFDTFAYHTAVPYKLIDDFHYIALIRSYSVEFYCPTQVFPDVFSDEFKKQVDESTRAIATELADCPNLLGYAYSDMPAWRVNAKDLSNPWVDHVISLSADSPGKRQWVELLKENYETASDAAAAYGFTTEDWNTIAANVDWKNIQARDSVLKDKNAFLLQIIDLWCKVHHDAVRRYDPHHLILGDKVGNGIHPDAWEIIGRYSDMMNIQWYAFFDEQKDLLEKIYQTTGKPILMGDSSFSVVKPYQTKAKGVKVESQDAVGDAYYEYLESIMALPYVIGWHYCGYIEGHVGMNRRDCCEDRQSGFLDPWGNPFEYTLERVTEANRKAKGWHQNANH